MKASRMQIARVVAGNLLSGDFGDKDVTSLAAYLLNERRTGDLSSLMRDVRYEWARRGVIEVVATSAHELTDEIKKRIEEVVRRVFPDTQRIIIADRHDSQVIGGVKLQFSDHQIDLTVAGDIRKFKTLATQGKDN